MKQLCFLLLFIEVVIIQADTRKIKSLLAKKLPCERQYTKIEFGKGVNCKGDTITIFEYANNPLNKDIPL